MSNGRMEDEEKIADDKDLIKAELEEKPKTPDSKTLLKEYNEDIEDEKEEEREKWKKLKNRVEVEEDKYMKKND